MLGSVNYRDKQDGCDHYLQPFSYLDCSVINLTLWIKSYNTEPEIQNYSNLITLVTLCVNQLGLY